VTRALHPGWRIVDHRLAPLSSGGVRAGDELRHASNALRYELLHETGGYWLDWDVVLLCPLYGSATFVAAVRGQPEGCVMGAEPAAPFLERLVTRVRALVPGGGSLRSTEVSGALVLRAEQRGDVQLRPEFIPLDSLGRPTGISDPAAVHLWSSSSQRAIHV
jgi:hypothetical protein